MATEMLVDEEEELIEEDLPQYVPPPHFSESYPLSEVLICFSLTLAYSIEK